MPARVGILVGPRGRGSNMRALVEASRRGDFSGAVTVVVSPMGGTPATEWAEANGVPVVVVPKGEGEAVALAEALAEVDILCLAGFLRLLPDLILRRPNLQVLNIHPALLPKFGGKGMYGIRVHEAVLAGGERESGCTVHRVTERYDEGEVLIQLKCVVEPNDTPDTLATRVLELEHRAYPLALQKVIDGGS